jgi:DNA anti-recombination protein RmuC
MKALTRNFKKSPLTVTVFGLLCLTILLMLGACQTQDSKSQTGAQQEEREHTDSSQISNLRQEYRQRLDSISDKLANLKVRIQNESAESKEKIASVTEDQIDKLEDQKHRLSEKLDEMREVSEDKWVEFKESFEDSLNELETEIEKLTN